MDSVEISSSTELSQSHVASISAAQITPHYFFEYRQSSTPVVVTGLLAGLPVWNLDYLCQHLGDRLFPIRQYGAERYQLDKRQWTTMGSAVETHIMPFAEYVARLQDGTAKTHDLYLGKCALPPTALSDSLQLKQAETQLGLQAPITEYNLWVGLGGHTTCLHCDPFDGVLMQLFGNKRVLLFPPDQLANLYPFPILTHLWAGLKRRASYSQVYPDHPDLDAFPRFRVALQQQQEVILHPGDVLFIPVGWWHEVISMGEGVVCSMNRFWSIFPRSRAWQSWNKWRIHLGSVLAIPHSVWTVLTALPHPTRFTELQQLRQKL